MSLKFNRMLPKFIGKRYRPPLEICAEFYEPLVKFLLSGQDKKPIVQFKQVKEEHIAFVDKLM